MSAGRLQLYDKRAGPRDRTSRLLVRVRRRPRAAPARVRLQAGRLGEAAARARARARRGARHARPRGLARPAAASAELLDAPRPLHALLRDQRTIAGIGRSWVDEILWQARLSPYKRGADLSAEELERLREAIVGRSAGASPTTSGRSSLPIPDKLPMPLRVHRHEGEPCPRCATTLRAVHFEDYVDRLLPRLPDRRPRAQGPQAVAAAEVACPR